MLSRSWTNNSGVSGSGVSGGPCGFGQPGCPPAGLTGCSAPSAQRSPSSSLSSPQPALRHRGVPGQVLALHAHRGGRARGRDGGQAAGGCLLRDQDTHRAGNGPSSPPCPQRDGAPRLSSRVGCVGVEQGRRGGGLDGAFPCALAVCSPALPGEPSLGCRAAWSPADPCVLAAREPLRTHGEFLCRKSFRNTVRSHQNAFAYCLYASSSFIAVPFPLPSPRPMPGCFEECLLLAGKCQLTDGAGQLGQAWVVSWALVCFC